MTFVVGALKRHLKKTHYLLERLLDGVEFTRTAASSASATVGLVKDRYPLLHALLEHRNTAKEAASKKAIPSRQTSSVSLTAESIMSDKHQDALQHQQQSASAPTLERRRYSISSVQSVSSQHSSLISPSSATDNLRRIMLKEGEKKSAP